MGARYQAHHLAQLYTSEGKPRVGGAQKNILAPESQCNTVKICLGEDRKNHAWKYIVVWFVTGDGLQCKRLGRGSGSTLSRRNGLQYQWICIGTFGCVKPSERPVTLVVGFLQVACRIAADRRRKLAFRGSVSSSKIARCWRWVGLTIYSEPDGYLNLIPVDALL
jgi:hypothetical protein